MTSHRQSKCAVIKWCDHMKFKGDSEMFECVIGGFIGEWFVSGEDGCIKGVSLSLAKEVYKTLFQLNRQCGVGPFYVSIWSYMHASINQSYRMKQFCNVEGNALTRLQEVLCSTLWILLIYMSKPVFSHDDGGGSSVYVVGVEYLNRLWMISF